MDALLVRYTLRPRCDELLSELDGIVTGGSPLNMSINCTKGLITDLDASGNLPRGAVAVELALMSLLQKLPSLSIDSSFQGKLKLLLRMDK